MMIMLMLSIILIIKRILIILIVITIIIITKGCTPEIDASESSVDFSGASRWIVSGAFRWIHCFSSMFQRVVTFPVNSQRSLQRHLFNGPFTSAPSGVICKNGII